MAVVPIHPPGPQHPLHVAVVTGPPDVVHDLVASPLDNRRPDLRGEGIQYLIPRCALPLALSALARALQRIENALWIVDLVNCRGSFGAVAPATARVIRVALQLLDVPALLVHVGQQPAGRLAV